MATYLPAAPGTYALRLDGDFYQRRTVVGWLVGAGGPKPLVASADTELTRVWLHNTDAVEHPDGRVESLNSGQIWSTSRAWFEEIFP